MARARIGCRHSRAPRFSPGVSLVRPAGRACSTVITKITRSESLLPARQREGLAEGQLRGREVLVGRKPMAKRWPDEQEPHRRAHRMRGPISSKSRICTEGVNVIAAGISVKAGAHYPGRPVAVPARATIAARRSEAAAGVSRSHSSSARIGAKGRTEVGRWKPSQ
jgi:hypothetical protein